MPGGKDTILETEDSDPVYVGKHYFKSNVYQYNLTHIIRLYDLGIFKFLIDLLGFNMTLPTLATDFGKHTEMFIIEFDINEGDDAANEAKLMELNHFVRFQSAFATRCYLNIGNNIKEDGSRLLGDNTKGIAGKIADINFNYDAEINTINGTLTFLQCYDLLNF